MALAALLLLGGARHTFSTELQAPTIAAFNHYVRVTEQRMSNDQQRVWIDALAQAEQRLQVDALRRGSVVIERLTTREGGRDINIPDGIVHHWVGVVFIPGTTVDKALALLQDYNHHADIYAPAVAASRLTSR